jgi:diguanylate cyclase (GGDEF)-like protein
MIKDSFAQAPAHERLGIYVALDRIPFLKGRYARKFAAATLIAVVPPLITLVLYLVFAEHSPASRQLLPALGLTYLAGFMATLWLHNGLLAPVAMSSEAVKDYLDDKAKPALPREYRDEAGRMMSRTQYLLELFDRWGERIENLSDLDEITGVYNRRAGEKRLAEEVARAERDLEAFHVALVDLRGFRRLREEHGYPVGDLAMVHLVGALVCNTRRGDWIARWGSNQFLVGLHRNRNAKLVSERILHGIEAVPCPVGPNKDITLRVACAVVEYAFGDGESGLVKRADDAMVEAKVTSTALGPSRVVYRHGSTRLIEETADRAS